MAIITLILMAQLLSAESPSVLTFSAYPQLGHFITEVDVGVFPSEGQPVEYWFRKTVRLEKGRIIETQWADTRTCQEARVIFEELARLEPVRPRVYGLDGDTDLMVSVDGVSYNLKVETASPFNNGHINLRTHTGAPLARWVDASFSKLKGCWVSTPPKR